MREVGAPEPLPQRPAGTLVCVGCAGLVPEAPGPVHPYMRASPGCWALYGEVGVRVMTAAEVPAAGWHHVDAYAVQHPGGAQTDRRQRQSVAVHLITLCLLHEFGASPERASARRSRTSERVLPAVGLQDWPYLTPPADLGAVTTAEVHAAEGAEQFSERLTGWARSAWVAWSAHHDLVRTWATAARRSDDR